MSWRALLVVIAVLVSAALVGLALGLHSRLFMVVEAIAIAFFAAVHHWVLPYIDRFDRGARGEEDVGAILEGLVERGWLPIHDVFIDRGNVDHIVVGPAGIFTIETKSHGGRMRVDEIDPRYLKQAYAEAKLIETVSGLKVEPLLVFSRAYLIGRVPCRRQGVEILPARMLAGYLERRGGTIPAERVATVHGNLLARVSGHA
jgi:Nuclease-related domain